MALDGTIIINKVEIKETILWFPNRNAYIPLSYKIHNADNTYYLTYCSPSEFPKYVYTDALLWFVKYQKYRIDGPAHISDNCYYYNEKSILVKIE